MHRKQSWEDFLMDWTWKEREGRRDSWGNWSGWTCQALANERGGLILSDLCKNWKCIERLLYHLGSSACFFSTVWDPDLPLCHIYDSFVRGCLRKIIWNKKFWIFALCSVLSIWIWAIFKSKYQFLLSCTIKTVTYSAELIQGRSCIKCSLAISLWNLRVPWQPD